MSLQEIKFLAHVSGQSQVRLPNTLGWNDGIYIYIYIYV